ncbi:hypothetical protein M5J14_11215 [Lysinibacillus sp. OL1_EC]|uniref:hypothetical protein n=1 Tax=Lysinibacillus sp. OL1_EC TaxID=2943493 RepID=UPI00202DCDF7|nr:hypothetical protein [Lysinibacillus sp. OL1_EC]MCM0625083.1 hypothetical protein [Lysinibacillus sp. OL1_EC]
MIKLTISTLLAIVSFLLVVLFIFLMYLLVQRQRESYFEKVCDRYLQNYSQLWYDYLFNNAFFSIVLVPRGSPQVEAIEKFFYPI